MKFLNQRGQTMIEYVLLLVVVMSLAAAFMNSDTYKKFVGKDSLLMQRLVKQMSYAYRHGRQGNGEDDLSTYSIDHDTYYNRDEGRSRFFTPIEEYPPP
ncbi:MAG: Tfp pilus assembly protein PilE [Bacteriovoracaceae bacterium]|jgi:Tfp pilus assembly protein PilE